jgi:hypothetical protein
MTDAEFGIWMMENLELLIPLEEELRKSGRLLPETGDNNIVYNAQVLLEEFRKRHPEQQLKAKAMEDGTADA